MEVDSRNLRIWKVCPTVSPSAIGSHVCKGLAKADSVTTVQSYSGGWRVTRLRSQYLLLAVSLISLDRTCLLPPLWKLVLLRARKTDGGRLSRWVLRMSHSFVSSHSRERICCRVDAKLMVYFGIFQSMLVSASKLISCLVNNRVSLNPFFSVAQWTWFLRMLVFSRLYFLLSHLAFNWAICDVSDAASCFCIVSRCFSPGMHKNASLTLNE